MKKTIIGGGAAILAAIMAWQSSSACGCIPSAQERLVDELFAKDQGETRAAMLIRDGKIIAQHYAPGYSDKTRLVSWSMAKSVTAVLIGELVADGKLKLDDPVPFGEWAQLGDPRREITLRQMLHMSSGIDHDEGLDPNDPPEAMLGTDTPMTLFVDGTEAMAAAGLKKRIEAQAGTKYEYSSITSLLLSELITRQLTDSKDPKVRAKAYTDFANERLFKPAGMTDVVMEFDRAGTQIGGSLIYAPLPDWGKFGEVLLTGKAKDGSTIIAPEWLTFLKTPSATDPGYGGHVWLNRPRSKEYADEPALFPGQGPDTIFAAVGHLGQYVIVSPEQRLVLVRLGKTNDGDLGPVRNALGKMMSTPLRNE
jgi:CubicO group peptidase (beta-lactamase class C family)